MPSFLVNGAFCAPWRNRDGTHSPATSPRVCTGRCPGTLRPFDGDASRRLSPNLVLPLAILPSACCALRRGGISLELYVSEPGSHATQPRLGIGWHRCDTRMSIDIRCHGVFAGLEMHLSEGSFLLSFWLPAQWAVVRFRSGGRAPRGRTSGATAVGCVEPGLPSREHRIRTLLFDAARRCGGRPV